MKNTGIIGGIFRWGGDASEPGAGQAAVRHNRSPAGRFYSVCLLDSYRNLMRERRLPVRGKKELFSPRTIGREDRRNVVCSPLFSPPVPPPGEELSMDRASPSAHKPRSTAGEELSMDRASPSAHKPRSTAGEELSMDRASTRMGPSSSSESKRELLVTRCLLTSSPQVEVWAVSNSLSSHELSSSRSAGCQQLAESPRDLPGGDKQAVPVAIGRRRWYIERRLFRERVFR